VKIFTPIRIADATRMARTVPAHPDMCSDLLLKPARPALQPFLGQKQLQPAPPQLQMNMHSATPTCVPSPRTGIICN
jgi:hypothetical protein